MKDIKDVKLGEVLHDGTIWILVARKQTLDNKNWYIVLALNPSDGGRYCVSRMMDAEDMMFGKYTPDFMEAIKWFLDDFDMSVRKKRNKNVGKRNA